MRVRLIYAKRGGACFVPHIALSQVFSRSASRAGIRLTMTQGFSPRPKLSFAPELPAGVVALNEPVDMFIEDDTHELIARMNESLPEGFSVSRIMYPDEGSPSLGKLCKHAEYLIRSTNDSELSGHIMSFYGESALSISHTDGWVRLIVSEPAQNPIGGLVKSLKAEGIIAGWHEVNIVRVAIGAYDPEGGSVCLS